MVSMSDYIWHHDKWFIQKHQNLSTTLRIMSVNEGKQIDVFVFCEAMYGKISLQANSYYWFDFEIHTYVYIKLSLNSITYTDSRRKTLVRSISVKIFGWIIKFEVRMRVVSLRKCHKTVLSFRYNGIQKLSLWMGGIAVL